MNKNPKKQVFFMLAPIMALVFLIGLIPSCSRESVIPESGITEQEYDIPIKAKKWAFLLYDDAEFNGYDPLEDFADEACSNEYLNILVLQDTENSNPYIWYIDEDHQKQKLKQMKEVNMGDYQTLRDFLDYAKSKCAAERYILSFYDHGSGWEGACLDITSGSDQLLMDELQRALTDAGGVDMVCFSAPCLMGALESVYELRNCAEVYIGSEETSGYIWWWYTVGDICETLKQNPDITNLELAEIIIQSIYRNSFNWESFSNEDMTMSAVRTDKIEKVINALEALSIDLTNQIDQSYSLVNPVYPNVCSFGSGRFLDAYDLFEKCRDSTADAALQGKLDRVMQALADAVIAECHGSNMENAHGLTIYFPDTSKYAYKTTYGNPGYGLDFSAHTQWDEFLEAYFARSGTSAIQQKKDIPGPYIPDTDGFYPRRRPIK
ncbi:MAG: hypothetical protein GTO45_19785 [Candidatus Aminicenantes bacterium]|nr:hypothetical protein [Candidatus Aminicenantes bacterium]NIM81033.1 hypothetical protein [Candidatus Aminicenantes bacterium]NIN20412.1 hypothetical protein [Candidatus Aminicenantes bacterium]NIN44185.1 hypothetical protein [Candidatus Aminicenantes bacterium]NIN87003.1 hypothetical protein [Candidatus Aminicenantes bacterium]